MNRQVTQGPDILLQSLLEKENQVLRLRDENQQLKHELAQVKGQLLQSEKTNDQLMQKFVTKQPGINGSWPNTLASLENVLREQTAFMSMPISGRNSGPYNTLTTGHDSVVDHLHDRVPNESRARTVEADQDGTSVDKHDSITRDEEESDEEDAAEEDNEGLVHSDHTQEETEETSVMAPAIRFSTRKRRGSRQVMPVAAKRRPSKKKDRKNPNLGTHGQNVTPAPNRSVNPIVDSNQAIVYTQWRGFVEKSNRGDFRCTFPRCNLKEISGKNAKRHAGTHQHEMSKFTIGCSLLSELLFQVDHTSVKRVRLVSIRWPNTTHITRKSIQSKPVFDRDSIDGQVFRETERNILSPAILKN